MSTVHRNAIITGHFDSLCLLCEVHITDNVEDHIDVPEHKKNLQQSSYFEKYEKHHIRKVKMGYYCEFCNILMQTLAQMGTHVLSDDHEKNLGNGLLKQVAEGIIAFDHVLIDNEAWNGLVEDSCFLCNEEFDDKSGHMKTASHVLNLIQKQVRLKDHEIIYRNVDGTCLHCLICNIIFGLHDNESHFKSKEHLKNVHYGCDLKQAIDIKNTQKQSNDESNQQEEKCQPEIEKIKEKQSNDELNQKEDNQQTEIEKIKEKQTNDDSKQKEDKHQPEIEKIKEKQSNDELSQKEDKHQPEMEKIKEKQTNDDSKQKEDKHRPEIEKIKEKQSNDELNQKEDKHQPEMEKIKEKQTNDDSNQKEDNQQTDIEKIKEKQSNDELNQKEDKHQPEMEKIKEKQTNDDSNQKEDKHQPAIEKTKEKQTNDDSNQKEDNQQTEIEKIKEKQSNDELNQKEDKHQPETEEIKEKQSNDDSNQKEDKHQPGIEKTKEKQTNDDSNQKEDNQQTEIEKIKEKITNIVAVKKIEDKCELKHKNANRKNKKKKPLETQELKEEREAKDEKNVEKDANSKDDAVRNPFQVREEARLLAKKNQITFKFGKQSSYCTICNVNISSSLKSMQKHVAENDHITNFQTKQNEIEESKKSINKIIEIPTENYIATVQECKSKGDLYPKYVIVNREICIQFLSLMMMTIHDSVIRCEVCEVTLNVYEVDRHRRRICHNLAMSKTPVVISLRKEFVREVRNEVFHCGFCNKTFKGWNCLTMHLKLREHITEKVQWHKMFLFMKSLKDKEK